MPKPEPGDWIRFYQGGVMVIGVVQYVRRAASWESSTWQAETDRGKVGDSGVHELRRRDGASWVRE